MLTQEETSAPVATAAERRVGLVLRVPDLVPVAVAGFSVPAMVLLLLDRFVQPLVLALGLLGAAVAVAAVLRGDAAAEPDGRPPGETANRETPARQTLWTAGALLLAAVFFLLNARWSAQNIYATRDPATYGLAGEWLAHHTSILIPSDSQVFGGTPGTTPDSAGFRTDPLHPGHVYAQGNHLLPALLGMASWIGGPTALFRLNPLLGALALLAMFGLVRRLAGGAFALVAVAALAVSMPMLAFSRDTYTEPLSLLLLFGGLSVLWRAVETGRATHFLVAGVTLGASTLTRIDGYASLFAVVVVAAALLAAARPGDRRAWLGRVGLLVAGTLGTAAIGYVDVSQLSSGYYHDLRSNVLSVLTAGVALALLGAAGVALAWTTGLPRRLLADRPRRVFSALAAGGIVALFAGLAARPLFMTVRGGDCGPAVAAWQHAFRQPIDPCRTYAEHSVSWIAWYYGWPLVVLAVLGLAMLGYRVVWQRDVRLLGVVCAVLALSTIYFWAPTIYPDQVWAMRRFLPVVIPGLLAAAAYLLSVLARRGRAAAAVAVGLAALAVLTPAVITYPVQSVRTGVPQLAEVRAVCDALPDDAAVLSLGRSGIGSYVQTMRSFCGVPSQALPRPTARQLAQVRAAAGGTGRILYVLAESPDSVPYAVGVTPEPFFVAPVSKWPERLVDTPQHGNSYRVPVYLGIVEEGGTVRPLPPTTR